MVKKFSSEETTKGLVANKLKGIEHYPMAQNTTVGGIAWYKEDSYKGTQYDWLKEIFKKASKKQTMRSKGTPDYVVTLDDSDIIVIIECKGNAEDHSVFGDNIEEYARHGYGGPEETEKYAINGALWYASFLKADYDVIAVGISGQTESDAKVTSFVWPKGEDISNIVPIENGYLDESLVSIKQYQKDIDTVLGRRAKTEEAIRKQLRRYTLDCANFLRQNGIEDNSKAGFVSAIILGLTNRESTLFKSTKNAIDRKNATKAKKMLGDDIGKKAVALLKNALYGEGENSYDASYIDGVWDIDKIPQGKRVSLKKFYDGLLAKDELMQAPKGKGKYFQDGDTVLSCCIYSLYENLIVVLERYSGVDVMGEFYTTFLRFTKGNAKEKGIVLTPKHITELFCDIAEYYNDKKFDETTKIIDICCGTGAFLISSLNRIKRNIQADVQSEGKRIGRYEKARKNCLIGVERDASMYALAYANMRFHGDGKSNLFNCSSLLMDSYAPVDEMGMTYAENEKLPLSEALKVFGDIDIGMINPPYSLDKKEGTSSQEYKIVKAISELKDTGNRLKKRIAELKQKDKQKNASEIKSAEDQKILNEEKLAKLESEFSKSGLREVVFQKGQSELDFVASMLHYLKKGGIGIAILPMSCAGSNGNGMRTKILRHHTLLACMTMPPQLFFDSHIGQTTCIMVFKAHIPHNNDKATFFGRWLKDGFKVIPHNGRKDSGSWEGIKSEWMKQIDGTAARDDTVWIRHRMNQQGEALPEAYIKTDFSKINDEIFKGVVRKYSLYKYMEEKSALEMKDSVRLNWLLDNYNDFEKNYSGSKQCSDIKLTDRKWERRKLSNIIPQIDNGKSYVASDLTVSDSDEYIFYITRTDNNNGVAMCVVDEDYPGREKKDAITIGDTTATIFYQSKDFVTGPHMIVARADWFNVYTAHFLIAVLNLEKYRYPVFGRAFLKDLVKETELLLPIDDSGAVDYGFMEQYIKSLPYSKNIC